MKEYINSNMKAGQQRLDKKHIRHTEERMEVWRRGFGLRCDVNGKLFVYAVGKKEDFEVGD